MTEILTSTINVPVAVALLFGLAGAVFIGIYAIRRLRGETPGSSIDAANRKSTGRLR